MKPIITLFISIYLITVASISNAAPLAKDVNVVNAPEVTVTGTPGVTIENSELTPVPVKVIVGSQNREIVRIRTGGPLNTGSSRSSEVIMDVPINKVLVIETISVDIRVPGTAPVPEVARLVVVTGSAFPPGTGSPLIDLPVTRMATDPAGNFVNYVALENMRAYADGLVQYSIDLNMIPSGGAFDLSLFGYLLPVNSPSLAP